MANIQQGFKGISFPFRIGNKGGVVMSTTSTRDITHIIESMQQILLTRPNERCMEYDFKSDIVQELFEIDGEDTNYLIEYQVKDSLKKLEDRIEVVSVDVSSNDDGEVYAEITFNVLAYNTVYKTTLKVGDVNADS